jgi:Transmembrane domain of unknown function (DUF3566)
VTTGSGDPRVLGGGPLLGGESGKASRTRSSTVSPETPRTDGESPTAVTSVAPEASGALRRPMTVGTAPITRKKGRRARLTVKRIDPWTTLKFSFVYGLAGMIVLLVSVVVLYGIVDAMGVITSLRSFINDVGTSSVGTTSTTTASSSLIVWLTFSRVMLVAIVIGLINVVLFTAFATLTAFIYNVCTDIVGGIEVTLAERN